MLGRGPRRVPAEWEPQKACWLAWPADERLWQEDLRLAQEAVSSLARALVEGEAAGRNGEGGSRSSFTIELLVHPHASGAERATVLAEELGAHVHRAPYGDIWLRDTAPIFTTADASPGPLLAHRFRFNGWGEKYLLEGDNEVGKTVAALADMPLHLHEMVLEGGAVEVDGAGTCMTTRSCLLNPNRNPTLSERDVEEVLERTLGLTRVHWLSEGLANDHTDGHIDNLARFLAPGVVVCMEPEASGDPNREVLEKIIQELRLLQPKLEVLLLPAPGPVLDGEGKVMPASYLNFYHGNSTLVMPTFDVAADDKALALLADYTGKPIQGVSSRCLLTGGGTLHCISRDQPKG